MSTPRLNQPAALEDAFLELQSPNYGEDELDELIKRYSQNRHPAAQAINQILEAVRTFKDASTLESPFKEMRDDSKDDASLVAVLNAAGSALKLAKQQRDSEKDSKGVLLVFNKVIDYCEKSIATRLVELEGQDRIFAMYAGNGLGKDNVLKRELPPVTLKALVANHQQKLNT